MKLCVSIDYDYLKNVMKVFIYFGISSAKTGVFVDIFTYCNVRKLTVFFNPSISNPMSLTFLLITMAFVGGKQKERLACNKEV